MCSCSYAINKGGSATTRQRAYQAPRRDSTHTVAYASQDRVGRIDHARGGHSQARGPGKGGRGALAILPPRCRALARQRGDVPKQAQWLRGQARRCTVCGGVTGHGRGGGAPRAKVAPGAQRGIGGGGGGCRAAKAGGGSAGTAARRHIETRPGTKVAWCAGVGGTREGAVVVSQGLGHGTTGAQHGQQEQGETGS